MKLKTYKLDNLNFDKNFDLIKIDAQESELDIIKGGMNIIRQSKSMIVETQHIEYNIGAPMINQIIELLTFLKFEFKETIEKIYHPADNNIHIQSSLLFLNKK